MKVKLKSDHAVIQTKTGHAKIQFIRVVDVAFIGPVCIYAGAVKSGLPMFVRISLIAIGAATIYYNFKNFVQIEKMLEDMK